MKKKFVVLLIAFFLLFSQSHKAEAALPTFDAVNAALNQLHNSILNSGFIRDLELAAQRLDELRATYMEMVRFNSGLDEIFNSVIGDPIKKIFSLRGKASFNAFSNQNSVLPKLEMFNEAKTPTEIKQTLEAITGELPDTKARPYIAFEEAGVIDGFQMAKEIREAGNQTREASNQIIEHSLTASPKGAARLSAQALGNLMVLNQQNQEAVGKLIELQATQVEQVSREEKRMESARLAYMNEMNQAIDNVRRID